MNLIFFQRPGLHGALPGMSDEVLGAAFLVLALLAGWLILKRH